MRDVPAPIPYLAAQPSTRVIHLLRFTAGATTYYFSSVPLPFDGHAYLPYLVIEQGPRYTRKITGRTCRVALNNVDLAMRQVMKTQRDVIQGCTAVLSEFWLEANGEFVIARGELSAPEVDENRVALTINGIELNTVETPVRPVSQDCTWIYKSADCGSASGETSCDKSFANCTVRAATARFNGFLHLTRTLSEAVQGASGSNVSGGGGGSGDDARDVMLRGDA
jgi:hypothetical protein